MTEHQFGMQMDRLKAVYGERAYPAERISQIWQRVHFRDERVFAEAVNLLIAECAVVPMASKILEAVSAASRRLEGYERAPQTIRLAPYPCIDCYDTGYMFCKLTEIHPETLVFCHCDIGGEKAKGDTSHMPRWESDTYDKMYGFIKIPFPLKKFVPETESERKMALKGSGDLVAWWKMRKQEAHQWWKQKANNGSKNL